MTQRTSWDSLRDWLAPIVFLSNNWISLAGVLLVTTSVVFWLFLLPALMRGETSNPYEGILLFLILPGVFFTGLVIIPAGILLARRRAASRGDLPAVLPPLDFRNRRLRRLLVFIGAATLANMVIAAQFSYGAVSYMESVTFCGQTCHTVMQPEFAAYQNSPHSRVECVKCHIGPGASWFVKSKLSGVWQVVAVTFNTFERPVPTPVRNLRPARETCEACHWPQKFGADRLRIISKFADDEANTRSRTVLLMRIGGGRRGGPGIHGAHLGEGISIRYAHADEKRQTIPWIEIDKHGRKTVYQAPDTKAEAVAAMPVRTMDCMDCHNRPSHSFELPERAVDHALAENAIDPTLPFARKTAVELLKKTYASEAEARRSIPAEFAAFYRKTAPELSSARARDVERSAGGILAIYSRNVFPTMKVTWGTYPNHIGHTDFPGCFRCHDDEHKAPGERKITQDCNTCHQLLAMEEVAHKILSELGLEKQ